MRKYPLNRSSLKERPSTSEHEDLNTRNKPFNVRPQTMQGTYNAKMMSNDNFNQNEKKHYDTSRG